jgi:hypothetical protein
MMRLPRRPSARALLSLPALALPILALPMLACADASSESGADDVTVPAEWEVEEQVRIGSLDDPEHSLVAVGGVRIAPDGRLYVLQAADDQIRVYGADGDLQRRIGRSGEGPGEFGSISGLGFRGDTLYVADRGLNRLSLLTLDGEILSSEPWPSEVLRHEGGAFITSVPQVLREDGSGILGPGMMVRGGAVEPGPRTSTQPWVLFHVRREPPALDTVVAIQRTSASNSAPVAGGNVVRFNCPFSTWPLVESMVDGSGAALVDRSPAPSLARSTFPVTRFGPSGDTAFSVSIPYDPVPVDAERVAREIETIRDRSLNRDAPAPSAADVEAALREIDCIPVALPPVRAVVTAQDGTIWLQREDVPGSSVSSWDVVGSDGRWVGRLDLPAEETVAAAAEDVLVTTRVDAFGVPYITRYRLAR